LTHNDLCAIENPGAEASTPVRPDSFQHKTHSYHHHRAAMTKLSKAKLAIKTLLGVAVVITVAALTFLFLERCS